MISNAFKGAYQNEVSQQNQSINTATAPLRNAIATIATIAGLNVAGAKKYLKQNLSGAGGTAVAAVTAEKTDTVKANDEAIKMFSGEEVANTISSTLGSNPINNTAKKELSTVFEMLSKGKEEEIINKKGDIESSLGNIDPNSNLGKQVLSQLYKKPEESNKTKNISVANPTITISEKELKDLDKKSYFKEDKDTIEERVEKRNGITYNWNETGYLLTNGNMLDLSGKKQGGPSGTRSVDHREIFDSEDYNDSESDEIDGNNSMVEFMKRGNIRISPEYPGINISSLKEPSKEQYRRISDLIRTLGRENGYFAVDIDDKNGNNIKSFEYDDTSGFINAAKIISDIQLFFKEGK